jgi:four helix bundle protein
MIAKFGTCVQELEETNYWLELLNESGVVSQPMLEPLRNETDQLLAILTASIKRLSTRTSKTSNS